MTPKELREQKGLTRKEDIAGQRGINRCMLQDCEQGHKNITSAKGDLPPCCSKKLRLLYQFQSG